MFETMIRGMYESGIRPRPYRTNSKPNAPIGGQKETMTSLKEINSILKEGLKEINETLQEILEKVEKGKLRTQAPA